MKTAPSSIDNDQARAAYLAAAAADENPDALLLAIAEVAKAQGMAQIAETTGLGRPSLYKSLAPGAHPRFETVRAVLHALGLDISITTRGAAPAPAKRVAEQLRQDAAKKIMMRRIHAVIVAAVKESARETRKSLRRRQGSRLTLAANSEFREAE